MRSSRRPVGPLIREIDRTIQRYILKKEPVTLYEPVRYLLHSGGKRLRSMIVTLSGALFSRRSTLEAAAAVEMLHNFSLIHDDIMDHDDTRRGRLTIHTKWNTNVAILAGDVLAALSVQALTRCPEKYVGRIVRVFSEGFVALCEGQALDKEFESGSDVRERDYLRMIYLKTASLFGLAAEMGALLGGARPKEAAAMRAFGVNFGMAFQIQDDLLDIIADAAVLGKDVGSDLKERKKTYVSILASKDPAGRDLLARFQTHPEERSRVLEEFKNFLDRSGIRKRTEKKIDGYTAAALKSLKPFREVPAKGQLIAVTRQMRHRQN